MMEADQVITMLPPKVKDLTGHQFTDLTVLTFAGLGRQGAMWNCACVCGKTKTVDARDLKTGNTKSCGCRRIALTKKRSTKHGQTCSKHHTQYDRAYKVWRSMLNRCHTKSSNSYPNYGGRGILVCDRWRNSFDNFYEDMGKPPEGFTIERIDVNSGYNPENCKWASIEEQHRNKRSNSFVLLNGVKMIQADAARQLGVSPATISDWKKGRTRKPDDLDLVFLQTITQ
jgi:hypothetical protein